LLSSFLLTSIQANHAVVTNKKGTVTLKPEQGKILVNGQQIKAETQLHHNDRSVANS
jgi:hypothetical protein